MTEFFQDAPVLGNQYDADRLLRSYLQRVLSSDALHEIEPDMRRFGQRVVSDVMDMAQDVEAHEPELVQFDAWGRRVDRIETARGWGQLDSVSAEEGLVAIGYERAYGSLSRTYQFAKLYLFNPSSAVYSCPLAMTDGAARCLEVYGDEHLMQHAYRRLVSRDPSEFWTSGQWMTERAGGSDVGRTETVARKSNGDYRLYGTKWFTSATTSQMTMTLARIEDEAGNSTAGSSGLSLFYLEMRDAADQLNGITIHRLKDKLGTRTLPTAELSLDGTVARLVGEPQSGVRNIISLINVTRIYNAVCAAATIRRGLALSRDYANRREAFGRKLSEHPLHRETLADLEIELQVASRTSAGKPARTSRPSCGC